MLINCFGFLYKTLTACESISGMEAEKLLKSNVFFKYVNIFLKFNKKRTKVKVMVFVSTPGRHIGGVDL